MKLTPEACASAVAKLGLMAFFPGDPDMRSALVWLLMQLVETEEQLDWLVERAVKLYSRWPGVAELRALYCSRYRPKDGIETYSEIYSRGFPHESRAQEFIPAPFGAPVSKDAAMDSAVRQAARNKVLPSSRARSK